MSTDIDAPPSSAGPVSRSFRDVSLMRPRRAASMAAWLALIAYLGAMTAVLLDAATRPLIGLAMYLGIIPALLFSRVILLINRTKEEEPLSISLRRYSRRTMRSTATVTASPYRQMAWWKFTRWITERRSQPIFR